MKRASTEWDCESRVELIRRTALIVDEDARDLAHHAGLLEEQEFEVARCRTYDDTIRLIERELFDLALVAQGSPAFEGRVVMRYLNRYLPYTRSLVLTRCLDTRCRLQALELGADDYVLKPISPAHMNQLIERLLGIPVITGLPVLRDSVVEKVSSLLEDKIDQW